jgi:DNA-binding transcriptional LysR family regulator
MSVALEVKANVLNERMTAKLRFRHLRLLGALSRCSTLADAAQEIGVTQPAASQALREIESLLEMPLFERHARGLRATEVGRLMAEQSERMLSSVQSVSAALAAASMGFQRPLQVCAVSAALSSLVRPAVPHLRKRLAGVRLAFDECTPMEALTRLQAGSAQLALVRQSQQDRDHRLKFVPLLEDELLVAASPQHAMTRRKNVNLQDLASHPWSMPVGALLTAQVFQAACRDAGFVPIRADMQSMSMSLLLSVVADDRTLVAAPRSILQGWLDTGALKAIRLSQPIPLPPLGALFHTHESLQVVNDVIDILKRPQNFS